MSKPTKAPKHRKTTEAPVFYPIESLQQAAMSWAESIAAWFGVKVTIRIEAPSYKHEVECDGREFTPTMQRPPQDR